MIGALAIAFWASLTTFADPGAPDACAGCHARAIAVPSHRRLLEAHRDRKLTCIDCHRGVAGVRTASAAHGGSNADALLGRANVEASCARCHLAGAVAGTELLARGAAVYRELGCPLCHRALGYGNLAAFARPLDAIGARAPDEIEKILSRPSDAYPGTPMPPFEHLFKKEPERARALLTFLRSLRGEARPAPKIPISASCSDCHREGAAKRDRIAKHRCAWIIAERREVSCARCHPKGTGAGECLYLEQLKKDCGVCHAGGAP